MPNQYPGDNHTNAGREGSYRDDLVGSARGRKGPLDPLSVIDFTPLRQAHDAYQTTLAKVDAEYRKKVDALLGRSTGSSSALVEQIKTAAREREQKQSSASITWQQEVAEFQRQNRPALKAWAEQGADRRTPAFREAQRLGLLDNSGHYTFSGAEEMLRKSQELQKRIPLAEAYWRGEREALSDQAQRVEKLLQQVDSRRRVLHEQPGVVDRHEHEKLERLWEDATALVRDLYAKGDPAKLRQRVSELERDAFEARRFSPGTSDPGSVEPRTAGNKYMGVSFREMPIESILFLAELAEVDAKRASSSEDKNTVGISRFALRYLNTATGRARLEEHYRVNLNAEGGEAGNDYTAEKLDLRRVNNEMAKKGVQREAHLRQIARMDIRINGLVLHDQVPDIRRLYLKIRLEHQLAVTRLTREISQGILDEARKVTGLFAEQRKRLSPEGQRRAAAELMFDLAWKGGLKQLGNTQRQEAVALLQRQKVRPLNGAELLQLNLLLGREKVREFAHAADEITKAKTRELRRDKDKGGALSDYAIFFKYYSGAGFAPEEAKQLAEQAAKTYWSTSAFSDERSRGEDPLRVSLEKELELDASQEAFLRRRGEILKLKNSPLIADRKRYGELPEWEKAKYDPEWKSGSEKWYRLYFEDLLKEQEARKQTSGTNKMPGAKTFENQPVSMLPKGLGDDLIGLGMDRTYRHLDKDNRSDNDLDLKLNREPGAVREWRRLYDEAMRVVSSSTNPEDLQQKTKRLLSLVAEFERKFNMDSEGDERGVLSPLTQWLINRITERLNLFPALAAEGVEPREMSESEFEDYVHATGEVDKELAQERDDDAAPRRKFDMDPKKEQRPGDRRGPYEDPLNAADLPFPEVESEGSSFVPTAQDASLGSFVDDTGETVGSTRPRPDDDDEDPLVYRRRRSALPTLREPEIFE